MASFMIIENMSGLQEGSTNVTRKGVGFNVSTFDVPVNILFLSCHLLTKNTRKSSHPSLHRRGWNTFGLNVGVNFPMFQKHFSIV